MGSSNLPLILWYATFAVIGALLYKKKRVRGAIIGLVVALIAITLLALTIGG